MYWFWHITITCKVLDKNPERWLCYVLKHIDSMSEDNYYILLPEFWEDVENRPTVLYLPHLSLPSGMVLNPKPSLSLNH